MYKGKNGKAIRASTVATPLNLMLIGDSAMIYQATKPMIVIDEAI